MKILKKVLFGILLFIGALLVISFFLPKNFKVERSIQISASKEDVFHNINNLQSWVLWNPWQNKDSTMKLSYFGPEEGIGATQKWTSNDGNGKLSITESIPFERVTYQFQMEDFDPIDARFIIETQLDRTVKLTWISDGELGNNPIKKYFGLALEIFMGKDYENGLANIKMISEKK